MLQRPTHRCSLKFAEAHISAAVDLKSCGAPVMMRMMSHSIFDCRHCTPRACGIIGIHRQSGSANAELYEGLLSLQHRGQDSAGMVTTDWVKFHERKDNGLVSDVFNSESRMRKLPGGHGQCLCYRLCR